MIVSNCTFILAGNPVVIIIESVTVTIVVIMAAHLFCRVVRLQPFPHSINGGIR